MLTKQDYRQIKEMIHDELRTLKLLTGQWHVGTVDTVTSTTRLKVFLDGSTTSITIPCNPDVTFVAGDKVWVVFINGNARDKFVLCKRGI